MIVIFHLHVYLTHIVTTFTDSLDRKFLQGHMTVDNLLQSLYRCIYRTVSTGSGFKLLTGDIQSQTGNRTHTYSTGHLQIFQFHAVILSTVCTGKHQDIIIINIFLLIRQFQESFIYLIQLFLFKIHA